jgi:TetR/AcrR family transcriptional regulator, transcriptional repressor for nem operon
MAAPSNTRNRIVLSALQLFAAKGYGSTSVADVRQAADIYSGSLYHFFPGKQDLLLAVLEAYRGGIGPMLLQPAWAGVKDPIEKVFALLGRYRASLLQTECTYGCPIGSLALELHEPDPPVRQLLAENFDGWIDAIEGCLKAAGNRLPANIDRRELAGFVLTTMEGAVMQTRTYRDIKCFDGSVRQLRRYFNTLLSEASRPARSSKTTFAGATRKRSKRK